MLDQRIVNKKTKHKRQITKQSKHTPGKASLEQHADDACYLALGFFPELVI